ncbi:MAG TPA: hypothetical protein PK360_04215, partial [bacterium]|nr:hypothetical protein [bacterium]
MPSRSTFLAIILPFTLLMPALGADRTIPITPQLTVVPGPVNGVLLEENGRILAIYGDPRPEPAQAEQVLFTHFRRDAAWAGQRLVDHGAKAVV